VPGHGAGVAAAWRSPGVTSSLRAPALGPHCRTVVPASSTRGRHRGPSTTPCAASPARCQASHAPSSAPEPPALHAGPQGRPHAGPHVCQGGGAPCGFRACSACAATSTSTSGSGPAGGSSCSTARAPRPPAGRAATNASTGTSSSSAVGNGGVGSSIVSGSIGSSSSSSSSGGAGRARVLLPSRAAPGGGWGRGARAAPGGALCGQGLPPRGRVACGATAGAASSGWGRWVRWGSVAFGQAASLNSRLRTSSIILYSMGPLGALAPGATTGAWGRRHGGRGRDRNLDEDMGACSDRWGREVGSKGQGLGRTARSVGPQ
jgi:hypothetical protein